MLYCIGLYNKIWLNRRYPQRTQLKLLYRPGWRYFSKEYIDVRTIPDVIFRCEAIVQIVEQKCTFTWQEVPPQALQDNAVQIPLAGS